jgi:hypothetical protein
MGEKKSLFYGGLWIEVAKNHFFLFFFNQTSHDIVSFEMKIRCGRYILITKE